MIARSSASAQIAARFVEGNASHQAMCDPTLYRRPLRGANKWLRNCRTRFSLFEPSHTAPITEATYIKKLSRIPLGPVLAVPSFRGCR